MRRVPSALAAAFALALGSALAHGDPPTPFPTRHLAQDAGANAHPDAANPEALLQEAERAAVVDNRGSVALRDAPSDAERARLAAAALSTQLRLESEENFGQRAAGSLPYLRSVQADLGQRWRPPAVVSAPPVLNTILNNVIAPAAASMAVARAGPDAMSNGRVGAARFDLDQAHRNSPLPGLPPTMRSIADANARRTRVDLELVQNEQGAIVSARVLRGSGSMDFDLRALESLRQAVSAVPARPLPGGLRTRWAMEEAVSRDPAFLLAPGLPGEPPGIIAAFEVSEDGEVHSPLRVHRRRRIWVVTGSRAQPATPAAGAAAGASAAGAAGTAGPRP